MTPLESFFDGRIFCINVAARKDRLAHADALANKFGFSFQRFEAVTGILNNGVECGNSGCTASHRALLDMIVENRWPRTLILEDDFDILHVDFMDKFEVMSKEVPESWDFLYLGAHFGEPPISRISKHVVRAGRLLTTSSYGISLKMAQKMREHISGVGPIDSLYSGFHREAETYVFDPRLCVQYPNRSDLQSSHMDNSMCMLDSSHIRMV